MRNLHHRVAEVTLTVAALWIWGMNLHSLTAGTSAPPAPRPVALARAVQEPLPWQAGALPVVELSRPPGPSRPPAIASAVPPVSRLLGLLGESPGRRALLVADTGEPARLFKVGEDISEWRLLKIEEDAVIIRWHGVQRRVGLSTMGGKR